MTRNTTRRSGSFKKAKQETMGLPSYPTLLPLASTPEIKELLCYVIGHYGTSGLYTTIIRSFDKENKDVDVEIAFGDWRGARIDLDVDSQQTRAASFFMEQHFKLFLELMRVIKLPFASFYLAVGKSDLILTDIRQGPQKLVGPGMVRDIFSKRIQTQDVRKIEPLTSDVLNAIDRGFGSYKGDLIIKPSKFRTVERDELGTCPLYVEVRR